MPNAAAPHHQKRDYKEPADGVGKCGEWYYFEGISTLIYCNPRNEEACNAPKTPAPDPAITAGSWMSLKVKWTILLKVTK